MNMTSKELMCRIVDGQTEFDGLTITDKWDAKLVERDLTFTSCEFQGEVILHQVRDSQLVWKNCKFQDGFYCDDATGEKGSLSFKSTRTTDLWLRLCKDIRIDILDCDITEKFSLLKSQTSFGLNLKGSAFGACFEIIDTNLFGTPESPVNFRNVSIATHPVKVPMIINSQLKGIVMADTVATQGWLFFATHGILAPYPTPPHAMRNSL